MRLTIEVDKLISKPQIIFWDFDGVIKDTIDVKGNIFYNLFKNYGKNLAKKVIDHHKENGGMSRKDKFKIYLEWVGLSGALDDKVNQLCEEFSIMSIDEVINSEWVPGVEGYLKNNYNKQIFILISAIPDLDLNCILTKLKIDKCFERVYGSLTPKYKAIKESLTDLNLPSNSALMIGDSMGDYEAALVNNVDFLLRLHKYNKKIINLNKQINYFKSL